MSFMTSNEVRKRFLEFFAKRGHAVLPSASLVPENDPSALFTTAGVQPLVPYILQGSHPRGYRLASVQKCVRTTDIDDVGDKTHATFFEMLGNWSIGDYFKEEAIQWSYELLTSKETGFGLDLSRLYFTVFSGSDGIPKDTEASMLWQKAGIPENRIYFLNEDNFWPKPKKDDTYSGPCGPSTEMFYDITEKGLGDLTPDEFQKANDSQQVVEIWNDVFMQYKKENGKIVGKLEKQNVDTGSGLERLLAVLQNKKSIFETDVFMPIMQKTSSLSSEEASCRVIADHLRTAIFLIADGVIPSNTDRGYVLRRLIRRAVFRTTDKKLSNDAIGGIADEVVSIYKDSYPEMMEKKDYIVSEILKESQKFEKTILQGLKQFEKFSGSISGEDAFILFSTYGFPFEMTVEMAREKGIDVDEGEFQKEFKQHQTLSRTASAGKFKGGLSGHGEMETKYHTATHLLNSALRRVLGEHVSQKGSNINNERLRFDFSHPEKMTDEQKEEVERLVNESIEADLPVSFEEISLDKARAIGALGVFGEKYPDTVKVYTVGNTENPFSREICGGPHVNKTGGLGKFKIKKEEAVSAGVRRIKAVLL